MIRSLFFLIFFSMSVADEKNEILDLLNQYNSAFADANYSEIVDFFNFPVSFNLQDKTVTASNKLKLRLIFKKLRGGLPEYYSYSKWGNIEINLVDTNIAIAYADFSRFDLDDNVFFTGSAIYHLRLKNGEWRIFSLTPYSNINLLD